MAMMFLRFAKANSELISIRACDIVAVETDDDYPERSLIHTTGGVFRVMTPRIMVLTAMGVEA